MPRVIKQPNGILGDGFEKKKRKSPETAEKAKGKRARQSEVKRLEKIVDAYELRFNGHHATGPYVTRAEAYEALTMARALYEAMLKERDTK